jgi:hypothetical protein
MRREQRTGPSWCLDGDALQTLEQSNAFGGAGTKLPRGKLSPTEMVLGVVHFSEPDTADQDSPGTAASPSDERASALEGDG